MQKIIKQIVVAIILTLLSTTFTFAAPVSDARQKFVGANKAFEANDFTRAAAEYEALLVAGYNAPAIYFNLASAYIMLDNPGKAVVNLRRAKLLQPRSEDIKKNLEIINSAVQKSMGDAGTKSGLVKSGLRGFDQKTRGLLSRDEITLGIVVLYVALFVGIALRKHLKSHSIRIAAVVAGVVSFGLAMLLVFTFVTHLYYDNYHPDVVVMKRVELRETPAGRSAPRTGLTLKDGVIVELIRIQDNWAEVRFPGGAALGWMPAGFLVRP